MIIDNFDIIKKHIDFIDKNDRYIVHIMRRPKDCKQKANQLGSNETQRLVRTYYIDSLEYFEKKIPAMKELAESTNSRVYIILQPKDNFKCLLNLGKKILDTIQNDNYSVKPEHLVRQAYCEYHNTRKKQWILDLDKDEMFGWSVEDVKQLVRKYVKSALLLSSKVDKDKIEEVLDNEIYEVTTRNGCHLVSPPFNLQAAQKECEMLFEGVKKFPYQVDVGPGEVETRYKQRTGWLHKDGMTLLYYKNDAS